MRVILTVVFAVLVLVSANTVNAQTYFTSGEQCIAAINSNSAQFYRPTFFSRHKPASSGEKVIGLEAPACVRMLTVKGYQWVAQKEGDEMVFLGNQILRRYDCGNPITDVRYPQVAEVEQRVPSCPNGSKLENGVCVRTEIVQQVVDRPVEVNPCVQITDAQWGSKGIGARLPSWQEIAIASGQGAVLSALYSNENRGRAALYGAGLSVAGTTAVNAIMPDYNVLVLNTSDGPVAIRKGKNSTATTPGGKLILTWDKNIITGRSQSGTVCFMVNVQKGMNLNTITYANRNGWKNVNQNPSNPIKSQTVIPVRPTEIPTSSFPAGTVGYCSRPRADQLPELCRVGTNGSLITLGYTNPGLDYPIF